MGALSPSLDAWEPCHPAEAGVSSCWWPAGSFLYQPFWEVVAVYFYVYIILFTGLLSLRCCVAFSLLRRSGATL